MAKKKLPLKSYGVAIWFVTRRALKLAPSLAIMQLIDSVVQATLPIITTYFAALTTTSLTAAYAGDANAASHAMTYVVLTSLFGIASVAWSTASSFISTKARYKIGVAVDNEMMQQFTSLSFASYDDKKLVDMHDKARRFSSVFSNIFSQLGTLLTSVFSAVGSIIALATLSPMMALIVSLAVLPSVVINIRKARAQTEQWETNITTRRRMWDIEWTLRRPELMAEMRVYGVVRHLIALYTRYRDIDEKERMKIELKSGWQARAANVLEAVVELGALLWVVAQIIARVQPVGQFVFVQQMVGRVMSSVGSFATQLGRFDDDFAHMIEYQEFMRLPTMDSDAGIDIISTPDMITVDHVSFRYPHKHRLVLRDVTLRIAHGQNVAIVGENGAGKSTLVKLLLGLYWPTKGTIMIDDRSLADISVTSWHRQIGLMWQNFVSYDFGTVRENIELGDVHKTANKHLLDTAMKQAEFDSVVRKLERGTDTFINKWMGQDNDEASATELSGGQYQRLALARNFYRDAPIIILDEPTSAIDSLAETRIFKRLLSAKDKTIITISHRYSTIKNADHIYVMKDGKIVEQGTAADLVAARGEFYTMFESQIV